MKKMNENYGEKLREIESEIISTQEAVEKINSQLKVASFTQAGNKSDVVGSAHQFSDAGKVVELENEVAILKKKYNKLALKLQSLKEDSSKQ